MGAVMDFVNPLLVVLDGLSLPVKMAWGVWLLWGLGQLGWYFWKRDVSRVYRTTAVSPQSSVRPPAVQPPSRKTVAPVSAVAAYGTSDFIAALDQEQAARSSAAERSSAYR